MCALPIAQTRLRFTVPLLAVWLLLVWPLTLLGYGSDEDAWLVAKAAEKIWQYRDYFASRTSGFPLFEIVETPMVHFGGWYLSNLLVLAFGLVLIAALLYLRERQQLSHPRLVIVCLAFLPVTVKNAASTMDYVPALAILTWAYVCLLDRRFLASAVLTGIATGFRPTSFLFVIPCAIYVYADSRRVKSLARAIIATLLVGTIAYSPALLRGRFIVPSADIQISWPFKMLMAGYYSLQLFGVAQTIVLLGALVYVFRQAARLRRPYFASAHFLFHVANMAVWVMLFLVMPNEPEYLLPAVPSLIFVIDKVSDRKAFLLIAVTLLSYHLLRLDVLGGISGERSLQLSVKSGYTVADVEDRLFKLSLRELASAHKVHRPTVLMLGDSWIPVGNEGWVLDERVGLYRQRDGLLFLSGRIADESRLKQLSDEGFRLVLWNKRKSEYAVSGFTAWRKYVEVVDDLETFFGARIVGQPIQ